ncbi:MAG: cytochrome c3 family protein, partial [Limisphaerales bacterium]
MSSENEKEPEEPREHEELDQRNLRAVLLLGVMVVGIVAVFMMNRGPDDLPPGEPGDPTVPIVGSSTDQPQSVLPPPRTDTRIRAFGHSGAVNIFDTTRRFIFSWDALPPPAKRGTIDTGTNSNIRRMDYAGSKTCADCHEGNFQSWSNHPHRFMNAMATPENVKGDFSGTKSIEYLGGTGRFQKEGDQYRMVLEKDGKQWVYHVRRTIGSRYSQYYLGILLSGSVPDSEPRFTEDHVLPFGYWIKEKKWVPTVHVFREEDTDHEEEDPYASLRFLFYDRNCAACHVTPPFGEWVLKSPSSSRMTEYSPRPLYLHVAGLIHEADPMLFARGSEFSKYPDQEMAQILGAHQDYKPIELGVTCEACHHGCKEHGTKSTKTETKATPAFSAISPHLRWQANSETEIRDRTRDNVNLICARCHSGKRPMYANGAHTWNSTEYADAVRGACYDPAKARAEQMNHLTCVTCHNPHKATGYEWPLTEKQNDQKCLECHQQFKASEKLVEHTHHEVDNAGSRCMNCHNPRINEGLEKMVHSHRIFNPTDRDMIEANQPNACNLCHLEKPIDWTIGHLR